MADKDKLKDMIDAIINKNSEEAQVHFHNYLPDKMKDVMNGDVDSIVSQDEDETPSIKKDEPAED